MEVIHTPGATNEQISPLAAVLIVILVLLIVVGLGYYFTQDTATAQILDSTRSNQSVRQKPQGGPSQSEKPAPVKTQQETAPGG